MLIRRPWLLANGLYLRSSISNMREEYPFSYGGSVEKFTFHPSAPWISTRNNGFWMLLYDQRILCYIELDKADTNYNANNISFFFFYNIAWDELSSPH